ncbi:MAG: hypothetical protein V3T70_03430 [Phycisphaerae bacterium]
MIRFLTAVVVLAAAVNAAAEPIRNSPYVAPLRTNLTMSAQPIESLSDSLTPRGTGGVIYSSFGPPGPFDATGQLTGPAFITDDYTTSLGGPLGSVVNLGANNLGQFRFAGGVGGTGQILNFSFFNVTGTAAGSPTTFTVASSFAVPFPQGGNLIWTLGFTSLSTLPFPNHGIMDIYIVTAGNIFLNQTSGVTVGSNGSYAIPAYDPYTNAPLVTAFQVAVPDPATIALLVTGGVVLLGKRAPRTRSVRKERGNVGAIHNT